jgi:ligand-binding sensor domain-containing protein
VYRYDGKSFSNYSEEHGLVSHAIQCTYEDREGRLWFGGWQGLCRFDGSAFNRVTAAGPWR